MSNGDDDGDDECGSRYYLDSDIEYSAALLVAKDVKVPRFSGLHHLEGTSGSRRSTSEDAAEQLASCSFCVVFWF